MQNSPKQEIGCCLFPQGHRATTVPAMITSIFAFISCLIVGFWATWILGLIALVQIQVLACATVTHCAIICAAVLSFTCAGLQFLLAAFIDGLLFYCDGYFDDDVACNTTLWTAVAVVSGILWIVTGVLTCLLSIRIRNEEQQGEQLVAVPVSNGQVFPRSSHKDGADIELASSGGTVETIREVIHPNGMKRVERTVRNGDGSKTIHVLEVATTQTEGYSYQSNDDDILEALH